MTEIIYMTDISDMTEREIYYIQLWYDTPFLERMTEMTKWLEFDLFEGQ